MRSQSFVYIHLYHPIVIVCDFVCVLCWIYFEYMGCAYVCRYFSFYKRILCSSCIFINILFYFIKCNFIISFIFISFLLFLICCCNGLVLVSNARAETIICVHLLREYNLSIHCWRYHYNSKYFL